MISFACFSQSGKENGPVLLSPCPFAYLNYLIFTDSYFISKEFYFSLTLLSIFKKRSAFPYLGLQYIIISFLKVWAEAMEKSNTKLPNPKDSKTSKLPSASFKTKK